MLDGVTETAGDTVAVCETGDRDGVRVAEVVPDDDGVAEGVGVIGTNVSVALHTMPADATNAQSSFSANPVEGSMPDAPPAV